MTVNPIARVVAQLRREPPKDPLDPSEKVGVACTAGEDRARPEFLKESLTSTILARFGAGQVLPVRPGVNGETDYDLDLHRAIALVQESKDAWMRLPREARSKYRSWIELQTAIEKGEYPEPVKKAPEPPAAGAGGSGASASVSAPGT